MTTTDTDSTRPVALGANESPSETGYQHLSDEETKSMITPYAFGVDSSLLGLPLATPQRRGLAMLIDTAFIALLAQQDIVLLMIVAAAAFFKVGSQRQQPQKWRRMRKMLRWLSIVIIMGVAYALLKPVLSHFGGNSSGASSVKGSQQESKVSESKEVQLSDVLLGGLKYAGHLINLTQQIESQQCLKDKCWQATADEVVKTMAADGVDEANYQEIIGGFFDEHDMGWSKTERQSELARLNVIYDSEVQASDGSTKPTTQSMPVPADTNKPGPVVADKAVNESIDNNESNTNITEWVKGIIVDDLGFGFGWAAFYFTLFTAWWQGQTPGKRFMGIRVIQLDGSPLSVWDSFGRYGGYGAGFATGLLGFAQIYWDPNRQAIQDKISATVVIKGNQ
jgi:uncharacterized RDD family membrane protein YckC